jgi:hypothetical protein
MHVREHAVDSMAELVEQRRDFIEGQQCRTARLWLRDVESVGYDRLAPKKLGLAHEIVHPGATTLVVTRKVVAEE